MKRALIVYGGWEGHSPETIAALLADLLRASNFDVEMSDSLATFDDAARLNALHLIVPVWTMGTLSRERCENIWRAIADHGVGLAGCHGGMGDAFRDNTEWQFIVGGQFVAHPGNDGTKHRVEVIDASHEITHGLSGFDIASEQYYMHVDPAVRVLATTRFPVADGPHAVNGPVEMPVVWTKRFGKGRVFYNSLGHAPDVLEAEPCRTIMRRGMAWAGRAEEA